MRKLLSRAGQRTLASFLAADPLLAFDYDGTIAPIVADRRRAQMRALTKRLLGRLAAQRPVIVVSGRERRDLRQHLHGIELVALIGNHGSDPWEYRERFERQVRSWRPVLRAMARDIDGIEIEDKKLSVSVHYRDARDRRRARAELRSRLAELVGVRIVDGKCLFNVLPEGAPDKGDALARACHELGHPSAIYVGDDVTDEDVFRRAARRDWMTVRVGYRRASQARYYLDGQRAIDEMLRVLMRDPR